MTDQRERLDTALASRYTVDRELGRGGMATVNLVEELRQHRTVAVQVIRVRIGHANRVRNLHLGVEITAQLTHPNFLPHRDTCDGDGYQGHDNRRQE
jgi:serine/threonine-protein kinase